MKNALLLCLVALVLSGCGRFDLKPPETIEEKMIYAEQLTSDGMYTDALEAWKDVRDAYVSPQITQLAELKIAETYFLQEEFVEATSGYEAYLKNYPHSNRRGDVMFRLGVCYEQQMNDPHRDQAPTHKALEIFTQFLQEYPDSPRRPYALELIDRCNNRLAAHEIVIGRYYLNQGNYNAAIARLEYVLLNYPHFPERNRIQDYLELAENRGLGETKTSRLMNRLYRMVLENEALREMQDNIMGIFKPL